MLMLMLLLVLSIGYLCDSHVCCSNASWYYASACASPCAAVLGRMYLHACFALGRASIGTAAPAV